MKRSTITLAGLAIVASLSLGLSGCDQTGGKPRIGVALFSVDDGFVSSVRRTLESAAVDKAKLSVLDGQNKQSVQNSQVEAMIADRAKVIILNPVDPGSVAPLISKAKAGGVPIVFFSRDPSTLSIDLWDKAYSVGVKAEEADALQVQMLAGYWKSHPEADKNHDGRIQYAVLRGNSNPQETKARLNSTQRSFDDATMEAVMVAQTSADWTRTGARQKMAELVQKHGSRWIEAVLCGNDEMALGAIETLRTEGYFKGTANFVPVIGVDGTRFALDAIAEGTLLGTARIDAASMGRSAFDLALALALGMNPSSRRVLVPYQKVTIDNYRSFIDQ